MKVVVAGSRSIVHYERVNFAIKQSGFDITELVCGMARDGVDMLAVLWADLHQVSMTEFPAQWRDRDGVYSAGAGHVRNRQMAEYADALVAVWDGTSAGTKNMIDEARRAGIPAHVDTWANARFFQ